MRVGCCWSQGGTDYALSAGDDDTTSYHQYSCLEPVFDKPNEPKYSFLGALHKLLVAHQDVILGQAPPAATPLSADKSCFAHTYTNASLSLHFVANEGKLVAFCPADKAEQLLAVMRAHPKGMDAAIIGDVIEDDLQFVQMQTAFGGNRMVDWINGEQLPRIC